MNLILKVMGIVLALVCVVSVGFWTMDVSVSDELPEGYSVNGYGWASGNVDVMYDEHVSIFHRYHRLYRNELCRLHDGTEVKFCGFSDNQCWAGPKIFLSLDGSFLEIEQEIPNSDYYISSRNMETDSIRIGWSIELKKGETASLLFNEAEVTFFGFNEGGKPIFKIVKL